MASRVDARIDVDPPGTRSQTRWQRATVRKVVLISLPVVVLMLIVALAFIFQTIARDLTPFKVMVTIVATTSLVVCLLLFVFTLLNGGEPEALVEARDQARKGAAALKLKVGPAAVAANDDVEPLGRTVWRTVKSNTIPMLACLGTAAGLVVLGTTSPTQDRPWLLPLGVVLTVASYMTGVICFLSWFLDQYPLEAFKGLRAGRMAVGGNVRRREAGGRQGEGEEGSSSSSSSRTRGASGRKDDKKGRNAGSSTRGNERRHEAGRAGRQGEDEEGSSSRPHEAAGRRDAKKGKAAGISMRATPVPMRGNVRGHEAGRLGDDEEDSSSRPHEAGGRRDAKKGKAAVSSVHVKGIKIRNRH